MVKAREGEISVGSVFRAWGLLGVLGQEVYLNGPKRGARKRAESGKQKTHFTPDFIG